MAIQTIAYGSISSFIPSGPIHDMYECRTAIYYLSFICSSPNHLDRLRRLYLRFVRVLQRHLHILHAAKRALVWTASEVLSLVDQIRSEVLILHLYGAVQPIDSQNQVVDCGGVVFALKILLVFGDDVAFGNVGLNNVDKSMEYIIAYGRRVVESD